MVCLHLGRTAPTLAISPHLFYTTLRVSIIGRACQYNLGFA